MRIAPKAYDVCDWCGARREVDDCSERDDIERHAAGWCRLSTGADVCGECSRERAEAIDGVKAKRKQLRKEGV